MPGPSDAALIARVLAGDDRHAFAELLRRHQGAVRGLLRRLCKEDHALADDLAQEAFLIAFRKHWMKRCRRTTTPSTMSTRQWKARAFGNSMFGALCPNSVTRNERQLCSATIWTAVTRKPRTCWGGRSAP
jgi:hypothetical protein